LRLRRREGFNRQRVSSSPFYESLETRGDQIKEVKNG